MKVDLSGVSSGFDVIPSGKYPARITDAEIRESGPNAKHPGGQYVNWEFTITEENDEYAGRKLWSNTSISHGSCDCGSWSNESLFGLKALLAASGLWNKEELDAADFTFDLDELFGEEVTLVVGTRQYQGEDQNDIKRIKPAGEATGASASNSLLP